MSKNRQIANMLDKDSGAVKFSLIDSDTVVSSAVLGSAAVSAGTDIYTNFSDLPASSTTGTQAFVTSINSLYIYNGSGWYKVALVNASPYWTTQPNGTYALNLDGTATIITVLAEDSDGHVIDFTATADSDFGDFATITKDSDNGRIFTVVPTDSENGTAVNRTGTVTFKASDGISFASQISTFTLDFGNTVDGSAETILLFKGAGNNKDNNNITYRRDTGGTFSFSVTGKATGNSFTPYRTGGYSTSFTAGNCGLSTPDSSEFTLGTSDFCMEGWLYITDYSPLQMFFSQWATSGATNSFQCRVTTGGYLEFVLSNSTTLTATGTQVPTYQWVHYAFVRDGSNFNIYQDGVSLYSDTSFSHSFTDTSDPLYIGRWYGSTDYAVEGYMHDVRFVVGDPVYTAAFTPPTEKLDNITNTKLLTCRLPYFKDESSFDNILSPVGTVGHVSSKPFGPYDYSPQQDSDHGLSVYFGGEGNYLSHTAATNIREWGQSGDSGTLEAWIYPTAAPTNYAFIYGLGTNGSTAGPNLWGLEIGQSYQLRGAINGAYTTAVGMPLTANNVCPPNTWSHVAMVLNSGTWTIYVNGKSKATQTNSNPSGNTQTTAWIGRSHYDDNRYWKGHLADLNITDTAKYTAEFTPPTKPVSDRPSYGGLLKAPIQSDIGIKDAAAANGMVLYDNVVSSTTQQKWSGSSALYFPGDDASIHMDTGESVFDFAELDYEGFTLEGWFYTVSGGDSYYCILDSRTSAANGFLWTLGNNGTRNYFYHSSSWKYQATSNEVSYNTWTHIALTAKRNATTKIWVGGSQVASFTAGNTPLLDSGLMNWGDVSYTPRDNGVNVFKGYWQDVRISRGFLYTSAFTPPAAEFEL